MALNIDKSETIILGTCQQAPAIPVSILSTLLAVRVLWRPDKIPRVILDKNLSMDNHVNSVSKSIHYHIHALRHIRPSISEDMA